MGLTLASLGDPEGRVPYDTVIRLGERALALTGDEAFGLHLAHHVEAPQDFDAGTLLLLASPTLRAALERMVRHQRFWGDGDRVRLVPVRGGLSVRYAFFVGMGAYTRHADECAMAEVALGARALSGLAVDPRVVRFRHAAPASAAEHHAVFRAPVAFRAEHTEIVFDDDVLDTPMQHANEAFLVIFEREVERALGRLPGHAAASERVRSAARTALTGGGCTLRGTARALAISTRTLQRQLAAEGTCFARILDAVRHEMALTYRARGVSIAETALLLGYSDATAFHRASRRWTERAPRRRPRTR